MTERLTHTPTHKIPIVRNDKSQWFLPIGDCRCGDCQTYKNVQTVSYDSIKKELVLSTKCRPHNPFVGCVGCGQHRRLMLYEALPDMYYYFCEEDLLKHLTLKRGYVKAS